MKWKIVWQTIANGFAILLAISILCAAAFGLIWLGVWALRAGVGPGPAYFIITTVALGIASHRLRWSNEGSFVVAFIWVAGGVLFYGVECDFFLPIALVMGAAMAGLFLIGRWVGRGWRKK